MLASMMVMLYLSSNLLNYGGIVAQQTISVAEDQTESQASDSMEVCSPERNKAAPSYMVYGVTENHMGELKLSLAHMLKNMPSHWKIVVYDLGDLSQKSTDFLNSLCQVQVEKFNFKDWLGVDPADFPDQGAVWGALKGITVCSWKIALIEHAFKDLFDNGKKCGYLLYGDASLRINEKKFFVDQYHPSVAERHGLFGMLTPAQKPTALETHPDTFVELNKITDGRTNPDINDYNNARSLQMRGGLFITRPSFPGLLENVITPAAECARNLNCVAPEGASGFKLSGVPAKYAITGWKHVCVRGLTGTCHRSDMSVYSILMRAWYLRPNSPKTPYAMPYSKSMDFGVEFIRNSNNLKSAKLKVCNNKN